MTLVNEKNESHHDTSAIATPMFQTKEPPYTPSMFANHQLNSEIGSSSKIDSSNDDESGESGSPYADSNNFNSVNDSQNSF